MPEVVSMPKTGLGQDMHSVQNNKWTDKVTEYDE